MFDANIRRRWYGKLGEGAFWTLCPLEDTTGLIRQARIENLAAGFSFDPPDEIDLASREWEESWAPGT